MRDPLLDAPLAIDDLCDSLEHLRSKGVRPCHMDTLVRVYMRLPHDIALMSTRRAYAVGWATPPGCGISWELHQTNCIILNDGTIEIGTYEQGRRYTRRIHVVAADEYEAAEHLMTFLTRPPYFQADRA